MSYLDLEDSSDLGIPSKIHYLDDDSSTLIPKTETPTEENESKKIIESKSSKPIVKSLVGRQYHPFETYYVIATDSELKLFSGSSFDPLKLFLIIKVHPSCPPAKSPLVVCMNQEINFNCGYAFDFSQIPYFELGDYIPVIELHQIIGDSSKIIGFSLLPLRVLEICEVEKKILTFLYRDQIIGFKDIFTGQPIGTIKVTVAFGYPEHQKYLKPNGHQPTLLTHPPVSIGSNDQKKSEYNEPENSLERSLIVDGDDLDNKVFELNNSDSKTENEEENTDDFSEPDENVRRSNQHRHHHHNNHTHHHKRVHSHHIRKEDPLLMEREASKLWLNYVVNLGWHPPDYCNVTCNWVKKAQEEGWQPPRPHKVIKEVPTKSIETQTDIQIVPETHISESEYEEDETQDGIPFFPDLIKLLNPKREMVQESDATIGFQSSLIPSSPIDHQNQLPHPEIQESYSISSNQNESTFIKEIGDKPNISTSSSTDGIDLNKIGQLIEQQIPINQPKMTITNLPTFEIQPIPDQVSKAKDEEEDINISSSDSDEIDAIISLPISPPRDSNSSKQNTDEFESTCSISLDSDLETSKSDSDTSFIFNFDDSDISKAFKAYQLH